MYMCMYVCVCKYRVIFLYNIPICLTWDVNISSIGGDTCMELFTYHIIYIYILDIPGMNLLSQQLRIPETVFGVGVWAPNASLECIRSIS
jgi:hypothetical protein